ncbi:PAS domain-containing sensor histidine kinase [Haloarchaeobius sp. HME9146]|uniref:PAS domain-containing sensor histidine kinase n=1 Tax=Haloarchaeobius sp. HME9146 TaxID=2978732 RepID=UPI0021C17837|nr:PAS domain-containing sensor histidine kinase [Haloarchaeobius sp. HME9146]MCT9096230.1 PAS domain-containing sensor histidine kinase [Haloarchaeobius sp. HME9146]
MDERRDDRRLLSGFHDSLEDAIYVFDEDRVLVDANARVGEVSGLGRTELLGWTFDDLVETYVRPDDAEPMTAAYDRVETGSSKTERLEFELVIEGEESVPADGRFNRHETYVIVVVRNLAELKERERVATELTEQLEVLNRVLRHDIRNDMNVVLGWAGELEHHVDDGQARTYLSHIEEAVEHTVELTKEVRDLAEALTAGESVPSKPLDLATVVQSQVVKGRKKFPQATISYTSDASSAPIRANEMVSSVFGNLISNAVIHNDEDHPTVEVSLTCGDDVATVRVADDGPGIPDSRKELVFGRGEHGVDSPGTGIGLYLVDKLVHGYDGTVRIEDNEPRGTVFVVELPIADP